MTVNLHWMLSSKAGWIDKTLEMPQVYKLINAKTRNWCWRMHSPKNWLNLKCAMLWYNVINTQGETFLCNFVTSALPLHTLLLIRQVSFDYPTPQEGRFLEVYTLKLTTRYINILASPHPIHLRTYRLESFTFASNQICVDNSPVIGACINV